MKDAKGRPPAKSLAVAPIDIDGDGFIDLIVANDTVPNFLFHNKRDGTFEEIGARSGLAVNSSGEARGAIFFWNQSYDCVIERNKNRASGGRAPFQRIVSGEQPRELRIIDQSEVAA